MRQLYTHVTILKLVLKTFVNGDPVLNTPERSLRLYGSNTFSGAGLIDKVYHLIFHLLQPFVYIHL